MIRVAQNVWTGKYMNTIARPERKEINLELLDGNNFRLLSGGLLKLLAEPT